MRTEEHKLSLQQRELVAVGASVGAGCHPCVSYHIKAATKAGVNGERLLAALASSGRVATEASERMTVHARGQLGSEVTEPAAASPLDDALASFGGALAANDLANIERHMRAAAELGASRAQLEEAIATAQKVQENATRIHAREARRLLERSTAPSALLAVEDGGCDDDCPCHEGDSAEEASVASERATDPPGEASSSCTEATSDAESDARVGADGSMPGPFGSPSGAEAPLDTTAGCVTMFKSACAQPAEPPRVEEPSTATTTTTDPTSDD